MKVNARGLGIILALVLLTGGMLFAQPSITSVAPLIGPVGSTIVIAGSNFGATPGENTVYLGGVRASVSTASSTSLSVIVPLGPSYAQVSVTTANLTAVYRLPFAVTFPGSPILDSSVLGAPVGYSAVGFPVGLGVADFDGDGKLDMVVSNGGAGSISVYHNVSTPGTLSTSSFDVLAPLPARAEPFSIAVGDLDGDGMPDLAVANRGFGSGNTVSVFLNTSTTGTISFSARVDSTVGNAPNSVALADIDGDGRLDIMTTNGADGSISVLRNTSSPGTVSLNAAVTFSAGLSPLWIAAGDVDGDGEPDVVVANNGSNSASVFRNTSTTGSISFETHVEFPTSSLPNGLCLADIDRDGKLDIVTTSYLNANLSVLLNTSTPGVISSSSFAPHADFGTGAVPRSVTAGDLNGDGYPDLLVANTADGSISILRNTSSPGTVSLVEKIDFPTGANPFSVNAGDIDGDGQPDAVVVSLGADSVFVLKNLDRVLAVIVSFDSTGSVGDTVAILGSNLLSTTGVTFNGVAAAFTIVSNSALRAVVPPGAITGPIAISTPGGTAVSSRPFHVLPRIVSIIPKKGPVGTIVNVSGFNFDGATSFTFQGAPVSAESLTSTSFRIVIPASSGKGVIRMTSPAGSASSSDSFSVTPNILTPLPRIDSVTTLFVGTADVNGDGRKDLVSLVHLVKGGIIHKDLACRLQLPGGGYGPVHHTAISNPGIGQASAAVIGDVDDDGKVDFLLLSDGGSGTRNLDVLKSFAGAVPDFGQVFHWQHSSGGSRPLIAIGDLNGDGLPDLAITVGTGIADSVIILLNSAANHGTFTVGTTVPIPGEIDDLRIGRASADSDSDLVVTTGNSVRLYENDGSGISYSLLSSLNPMEGDGQALAVDLNGDGVPDVVSLSRTSGILRAYLAVPPTPGSFSPPTEVSVETLAGRLSAGDLDGDGIPDLMLDGTGGNLNLRILRNATLLGGSVPSFEPADVRLQWDDHDTRIAVPGNLDSDAFSDIIFPGSASAISPPFVFGFAPASGTAGTHVTVTGSNLAGVDTLHIGSKTSVVSMLTGTSLTGIVTPGAISGRVRLHSPSGTASSLSDFIVDPSTICGTVYLDGNGNGSFEPGSGEAGLSGWTILCIGSLGDTLTRNSGLDGSFCFTGLYDTAYTLFERHLTGYMQTGGQGVYLVRPGSGSITGIDFGNFDAGSIRGISFRDRNHNGTPDGAEPGLKGWNICLQPQSIPAGIYIHPVAATTELKFNNVIYGSVALQGTVALRIGSLLPGGNEIPTELLALDLHTSTPVVLAGQSTMISMVMGSGAPLPPWAADPAIKSPDLIAVSGGSYLSSYAGTLLMTILTDAEGATVAREYGRMLLKGTAGSIPFAGGILAGARLQLKDSSGTAGTTLDTMVLSLSGPISSGEPFCTMTDPNGAYGFSCLVPGSYAISQTLQSGWTESTPPHSPILITSGASLAGINFGSYRPIDTIKYRTFQPESLAFAVDMKGKHKAVKRKADKVDFQCSLNPPVGASSLALKFSMSSAGSYQNPAGSPGSWNGVKALTIGGPFAHGLPVTLQGRGSLGKKISISYVWALTGGGSSKGVVAATDFSRNVPRLPMPDLFNVGEELFGLGGFPGGLKVGLGGAHSVVHPKYSEVFKSLNKKNSTHKLGSPDLGIRCLDALTSGRLIAKQLRNLPPDKQNNVLFAEMIGLRIGLVASQIGMTQNGFGNLIYESGTGSPLDGMTVASIASMCDSFLTLCAMPRVGLTAESLYTAIHRINAAFSGPMDTTSFSTSLVLTGVRELQEVAFLRSNPGATPSTIQPNGHPIDLPLAFELQQNYPNPFNPTTTITFALPEPSVVTLTVYNLLGQEVERVIDRQEFDDGGHEVDFDARMLASGLYFYRLTATTVANEEESSQGRTYMSVRKMLLVR